MTLVQRVGLGLLALIALVLVGLATWEPLTATRADPPPAHRYDTVIARDTWGVPHIFGRTDPDVAYGIGYAHAEDDFATLQEVLAMTRGRLGAMTGAAGAKTDYVVHLLGARATVDRDYDRQPPDVRLLRRLCLRAQRLCAAAPGRGQAGEAVPRQRARRGGRVRGALALLLRARRDAGCAGGRQAAPT